MTWWEAIILGIVEGVTEYLPVSSTGHLILTQRSLGISESSAANSFAICIQAGAILAVLGLYRQRVGSIIQGGIGRLGLTSPHEEGFRLGCNLVIAFLPAAVVGLLFDDLIEQRLFTLWPIVFAWFLGGLAILAVARRRRTQLTPQPDRPIESMTWQVALGIGLIQCLAMWPGTSRSLVTIVGGVLLGLSLPAAVEFSFLLGGITLLAATAYKAQSNWAVMLDAYGWQVMLIGAGAAWLSAVIAVKWMVSYLKKHEMSLFGYYRLALALVVATCILTGALEAGRH